MPRQSCFWQFMVLCICVHQQKNVHGLASAYCMIIKLHLKCIRHAGIFSVCYGLPNMSLIINYYGQVQMRFDFQKTPCLICKYKS